MKYLEPRVAEAAALRFFERRRLGNLWGLLRQPRAAKKNPTCSERRIPYAELVWLPYYIIRIRLRSARSESETTVSVEGYSGSFAMFQRKADIVDGEPKGETFHPRLDENEAARIARKELLAVIMRQRSGRKKPVPGEVVSVELLQYPFWVYYYERRRERLDIRVLDAVTRSKPGPSIRASLLNAFAAAEQDAQC
jgi:hypothetical protein